MSPAAEWIRLKSPNFELYTSAGERRGRETITHFEQVRDHFAQVSPNLRSTLPVRLVMFGSDKEYKPYRPHETAAAYYLGGDSARDFIVMGPLRDSAFPVAVHEYVHLLIKHSGMALPAWLNEGFADVYSTLQQSGGKVMVGHAIPERMQPLFDRKWIPLEVLFSVGHESPEYNEKERVGLFYSESWLLAHMLQLSNAYRPKFNDFLRVLLSTKSAPRALNDVYGKTVAEIQKDMERYVRSTSINVAVFDAKLEKPAERPVSEPVAIHDNQMVLAEILGFLGKRAEAEQLYAEAAKTHPAQWQIEQGLAQLALRSNDRSSAREHFAKAVKLNASDPQMFLVYGTLLANHAEATEEAVQALTKAVELKPDLNEARHLLGTLHYNRREYKLAAEHLGKVKKVKQEDAARLFLPLAFSLYETGQAEAAKQAAEQARKHAISASELASAERLLEFLTQKPAATSVQSSPQREIVAHDEARYPMEGSLQMVDCQGKQAVLTVAKGDKKLTFLIDDPTNVTIRSSGTGTVEFACGPQQDVPVLIEYVMAPDAKRGTAGLIRTLEFKK